MIANWLFHTSIELSLLIGLVLAIRPIVKKFLGAQVCYWLWLIPLIRIFFIDKLERPSLIAEMINLPTGNVILQILPPENTYIIPNYLNLPMIWLIGALTWIFFRLGSQIYFQSVINQSSSAINLSEEIKILIPKYLYNRKVTFYLTTHKAAPFVTGLLKPRIYLPNTFFEQYSTDTQKWILIHELTHLKRGDLWFQLIVELHRLVFWFNPIVHISWNIFKEDQEQACDYHALRNTTTDERINYGNAMLESMSAHLLPSTLSFFSSKTARFKMIPKHKISYIQNIIGILLCLIIAIFSLTTAPDSIAEKISLDDKSRTILRFKFDRNNLYSVVNLLSNMMEKEIKGAESLKNKSISGTFAPTPINEILDIVLSCAGYNYSVHSNIIKAIKSTHNSVCNADVTISMSTSDTAHEKLTKNFGERISLAFTDINLKALIHLINDVDANLVVSSDKLLSNNHSVVIGTRLLPADMTLQKVLNCFGFQYIHNSGIILIDEINTTNSAAHDPCNSPTSITIDKDKLFALKSTDLININFNNKTELTNTVNSIIELWGGEIQGINIFEGKTLKLQLSNVDPMTALSTISNCIGYYFIGNLDHGSIKFFKHPNKKELKHYSSCDKYIMR